MDGPRSMVERLERATNDHDVEAVVACFAEDYENETPLHPAAELSWAASRSAATGRRSSPSCLTSTRKWCGRRSTSNTAWTEWEMTGTRRDGTPHLMRGVIVFGVGDGVARWARFYLEPVVDDADTVDDAVRQQVVR